MKKSAILSPCRIYRYELLREWGDGPCCTFVGLNPSTADETHDDPTIRRCIGFAKAWGFGSLRMVNLFAFRATHPADMKRAEDPVGPDNDTLLKRISSEAGGMVVAAWGKDGSYRGRDAEMMTIIPDLMCLKKNQDGTPAHPLYLRSDLTPFLFNDPTHGII